MVFMRDVYAFLIWMKILLPLYILILTYPRFTLLWFAEQAERVQPWLGLNRTEVEGGLRKETIRELIGIAEQNQLSQIYFRSQ